MKLCWFAPDDHGGGVISVAMSSARQAGAAGHDAALLLMREPTGWSDGIDDLLISSLGLKGSACETPRALMQWLQDNPQDILLLNGGEHADPIIPYLPTGIRCVYVVHDTAARYWQSAVVHESDLHGIVAVSQTVADRFVHILKNPNKLRVIHNGSMFPAAPDLGVDRPNDILFLGGDSPSKGSYDVLDLWPKLLRSGFVGRLHWFGHLDRAFESRIARLPEANRIVRRGRTRRDIIFATAAASKVLLMLSRVEPFGMATIEGMSMGCVPVAWDINTGTKEIVTPETGFFAPLGNTKALAKVVIQAAAEHSHLAPLAANRARAVFSDKVMWQGYAKLFEEISALPLQPVSHSGQTPPDFVPPRRRFQLLPPALRSIVRNLVGRSPWLGYLLRDLRGW